MPPETTPVPQVCESKRLIVRSISSEQLFAGRREIVILHNGREYRLRTTQTGKLILTA